MKKILSIFILCLLITSFVPFASAEDEIPENGDNSQMMDCMGGKCGGMMKGMMKRGMMGRHRSTMVSPEEFSAYDEDTKAAWREMQENHHKKYNNKYLAVGAALAIAIAALGGTFAQGKVASSAMEGIARNPEASSKIFTPLVISLALIESIVIYSLVIALLLQGKM